MQGRLVSELSGLGRGRRYLLSCLYCAAGEMREVQVEMAAEIATESGGISIVKITKWRRYSSRYVGKTHLLLRRRSRYKQSCVVPGSRVPSS